MAYLSPRQLRGGSDIFERFVLEPNRELRLLLELGGVDLIFHICGELMADMVRQFAAELRPAMLSLGSSRKLWEDAAVVPKDIVLFGNLPTKPSTPTRLCRWKKSRGGRRNWCAT